MLSKLDDEGSTRNELLKEALDNKLHDGEIPMEIIGFPAQVSPFDLQQIQMQPSIQTGRYQNGRKKHFRRCANEIQKSYDCPFENCGKHYGCEGSLNLHIKQKHKGGTKTDRERMARQLIIAKMTG